MVGEPSPTATNGRDRQGRFAPGNRTATANPYARKVAALRSALLSAVTEEDIAAVVAALVAKAKSGDVAAVKELFARTLGVLEAPDTLERLEAIEEAVRPMPDARRGSRGAGMSVRTRLASLQRELGMNGAGCPVCGGAGCPAIVLVDRGEAVKARGCPRCGKVSVEKRIVLEDDDDSGTEA